jgi:uncharacterized protein YbaA (DUF1428 family)
MYINGWVVPVPTAKREEFKKWADVSVAYFKENGALDAINGWGDEVPDGVVTSLPMAVKLKPDETVVFGWITWPNKAASERAMMAMREDPRFGADANPMPGDGQRIIYGGFSLLNRM